jgi:hypothetical protein
MNASVFRALALAGVVAASPAWGQDAPPANPAPEPPSAQTAPDQPVATAPPPAAEPEPSPASPAPVSTDMSPAPEPTPASTPAPAAAPAAVQVQSLDQLDLFSTGRDAGLGSDVWKGASADIARAIIPTLAIKPLSPAGAVLARRLLAQNATAPTGAGADLDLAVARAKALMALGDADDASLVFDRTPGVADSAELSGLAAEAALISEQDDKACRIADTLTAGRNTAHWLRLRAFCQARAGKADEAQLTFNLSGPPGKDAISQLLAVYIAGAGDPGPASLTGGLDFAVSRALKLDLKPALTGAAPAIARRLALKNPPAASPAPDPPTGSVEALIQAAVVAAGADHPDTAALDAVAERSAHESDPSAHARLSAATAILGAIGPEPSAAARSVIASLDTGRADSPAARLPALDLAAAGGLKGETVLLALRIAQGGGATGPSPVDRFWIIRALNRVGLTADARAFAVEGLARLRDGP